MFTAITRFAAGWLACLVIGSWVSSGWVTSALAQDTRSESPGRFSNPIGKGADPWVIRDEAGDRYLWCSTVNDRGISVTATQTLTSMGEKNVVWTAPETGPTSREVWAPELHFLDGRWYVYFAASDGDNANHLGYVLESKTADPLGRYQLHGPLATGGGPHARSPNIWCIDMTVLELDGRRYAVWSGWDMPGSDRQYLYIAPMKSPTKLAGRRVRLCANDDYLWERVEPDESKRGLNEGPQIFQSNKATCIVYSCGASWLPTYKLGLLQWTGGDPMQPTSWKKHAAPAFESTEETYGVGHASFVRSPDGQQWWLVYHAKQSRRPGWERAIHLQPFTIDGQGIPQFGRPIAAGVELEVPAGQPR